MNFCKRSYQPILRYLYTETIKRGAEISLHTHFNGSKLELICDVIFSHIRDEIY